MKKIKVGIIGGTNGMGKWLARLLRKEKYTVHVCGRKTKLQINDLTRLCFSDGQDHSNGRSATD